MQSFLVQSLIASALLTIALNVLPRLFPKQTQRAEQRIHDKVEQSFHDRDEGRRVRVFFPWKAMLIGSIVLTVLVNLAGLFT